MIPVCENLKKLTPSAIRRFTTLAAQTPGCLLLTLGEPDQDTPREIRDAAAAALAAGQTHYAPNAGLQELRQAIAAHETDRGMAVDAEQVIVTVGATEALSTTLYGILNPGDEVIVFTPAYPLYQSLITMAGGICVPVDIAAEEFRITSHALEKAISPRTRAVILNNPNNPTGALLDEESLHALRNAILGKPIWLVCDQVYSQLVYAPAPDITLERALAKQIILCQSFSKPYAMTGWRVGYLVAPAPLARQLTLLHAANVSCVPTFLQSACIQALRTDVTPMRELYRRRRDYLLSRLAGMGLRCPRPEGAFYAFPDISAYGMDSETFCTRMIREAGVAAVPGSCFFADGFIRLSYACSEDTLRAAADRMEAFLKTL